MKDSLRANNRLLDKIQDLLLKDLEASNSVRDRDHFHSSEISGTHWCPRHSTYTILGAPSSGRAPITWQTANVFVEGNMIHDKYQRWLRDIGVLLGRWECPSCSLRWEGKSPVECPHCGERRIKYLEVPIELPEYRIIGHADALIEDEQGRAVVEIKSVGLGTVRMYAPALYKKYLNKEIDLLGIWAAIKTPFPVHIRQVMLYAMALNLEDIIILYEFKPTQSVKEFTLKFSESFIKDRLELLVQANRCLEDGKPAPRPEWATEGHSVCRKCEYVEVCWK